MSRILPRLESYHRPASMVEAQALLRDGDRSIMILGGGVSLGMIPRPHVTEVVGVERLGMDELEVIGDVLHIGAGLTLGVVARELDGSSASQRLLVSTIRRTATTPLRNLMTVGGVIAGAGPWSDLPVSLLVLDADIVIDETEVVPIHRFLSAGSGRILQGSRLITAVRISTGAVRGGGFEKLGRNATDLAMASAAVARTELPGDRTPRYLVAIGGLVSRPRRVPAVEDLLSEMAGPDRETVRRVIGESITLRSDPRAGDAYRLNLVATLVTDCLERANAEAAA